jgi:hypothetical protein
MKRFHIHTHVQDLPAGEGCVVLLLKRHRMHTLAICLRS